MSRRVFKGSVLARVGALPSILGLALGFGLPAQSRAQVSVAVATPPAPVTEVVLAWSEDSTVRRYNIYRKQDPLSPFPATPLNAQPLEVLTSAAEISALIPPGSDEWNLLEQALADPPGGTPFDPTAVSTILPGTAKHARLQLLARGSWRIAVLIGQGFRDTTVVVGQSYLYEVRGVTAAGVESGVLATDVAITAGSPVSLHAPGNLISQARDRKVLLLWDEVGTAAGFNVYRSLSAAGPFMRVNEVAFTARIDTDLDGNPVEPSGAGRDGFVDFQRYDGSGNPTTHDVSGTPVSGPENGTTYFYRVAAIDLLGFEGASTSPPVSATPVDTVPPRTPQGVEVVADEPGSRLVVRWLPVTRDTDGHPEPSLAGYRVYRYLNPIDPTEVLIPIGGLVLPPPPGSTYVTTSDADQALRSPHGETAWYYRVEAEDGDGNISGRSAAVSGYLEDITPPHPPVGVSAAGFEEFIRTEWLANGEPDIDGYNVYRSLCHMGTWTDCRQEDDRKEGKRRRVCNTPFVLVGPVTQADAEAAVAVGGSAFFEDRTVPAGSPLCYAYLIKAKDRSQNENPSWPIPDLTTETIVCERLRDKTPPEPAIISGLLARDAAVRVEWIGAPVQDIGAYHVYRADAEEGPYKWVGGATVEVPPTPPATLLAPYAPSALRCATIPQVTRDDMSTGSFLDTRVDPKRIYWYTVVGVDQVGNETPLAQAVPVSTFTFATAPPAEPTIGSVTAEHDPCGLMVRWTPPFDSTEHLGFLVYRSRTTGGPFLQVGSLVQGQEYFDTAVAKGVIYWYRVARLDLRGEVSKPSPAVWGRYTP